MNMLKTGRVSVKGLSTVPEVISFPRYNMKCSGGNRKRDTTRNTVVHLVSGFPLHFMLLYIAEI